MRHYWEQDVKKTPAGDVEGNAWTGMTRSQMLAKTTSDKYIGAVVVDESLGAIYDTLETLKVRCHAICPRFALSTTFPINMG